MCAAEERTENEGKWSTILSVDCRWCTIVVWAPIRRRQRFVEIVPPAERCWPHYVQYHSKNHEQHQHEEIITDALVRSIGQINALVVRAVGLAVSQNRQ